MVFLLVSNCVITLTACVFLKDYLLKKAEINDLKEIIVDKNYVIELYKKENDELKYRLLCKTDENVSAK